MRFCRVNFYGRCGAVAAAIALLASCGGDGASNGVGSVSPVADPPQTELAPVTPVVEKHTVGGTVTGLIGSLVLQSNSGDDLQLTADGKFSLGAEDPVANAASTKPVSANLATEDVIEA